MTTVSSGVSSAISYESGREVTDLPSDVIGESGDMVSRDQCGCQSCQSATSFDQQYDHQTDRQTDRHGVGYGYIQGVL